MGASFAETIVGQTLELDLTKARSSKKENLTTLCTDIFLIIIRMREAENLGEPAALRKLIIHYLELFRKNCRAMNVDPTAIDDAVYSLVALLDETVMSVPGECRDFWVTNPIQLELYGDNMAGQEFFRRLEKLSTDPERMKDVLEVFYICLCLGFEGKYKLMGDPAERDAIIDNLARMLLKVGKRSVASLSPHGRRRVSKKYSKRRGRPVVPLWIVGTTAAAILAFLWWFMHSLAEQSMARVLSIIQ